MKKLFSLLVLILIVVGLKGQTPQLFNYQAIIRDVAGQAITDQPVGIQVSLLQESATGTPVYIEQFNTTTNAFGLINLEIGNGAIQSGIFTDIDWSTGPYFIKIELDESGGNNYTEIGTSQILSVPYALHAATAENVSSYSESDPVYSASIASGISGTDTASWNNKSEFSGNYYDLANVPSSQHIDSAYIVTLTRTDEDFVDFGTFPGFTNSSDWTIIEKVMMPAGTGADGGWHFFRGKGWVDQEGDIAMQMKTSQVYAWVRQGGWHSVQYDSSFEEEKWYVLCLQYDATVHTLSLFVDGQQVGQTGSILPQDDSGNSNKLFWGGQDVDPAKNVGDLYSESSIVIASQDWCQRKLTLQEIQDYTGKPEPEATLYFSVEITSSSVVDVSGHGHDGINGNTPVYSTEMHNVGSDFSDPVHIGDDLTVAGDLEVGGVVKTNGGNSQSWDTAYGWGNHANAGYATIDMQNQQITNLADPVDDKDAANKYYIDKIRAEIFSQVAGGQAKDYDANTYNTVKIGNQVWMAENLKTTHYADGSAIPLVTDNTAWSNLVDNNTDDAYCFYNNDANSEYGALYTWAAAMKRASSSSSNPSNVQGVCPDGWHMPSDAEWKELEMFIGFTQGQADATGGRGIYEGGKLKETGTIHWNSPNNGATNESGFSGFGGGFRQGFGGGFDYLGGSGRWWTATEWSTDVSETWYRSIDNSNGQIFRSALFKSIGYSVRCVKD